MPSGAWPPMRAGSRCGPADGAEDQVDGGAEPDQAKSGLVALQADAERPVHDGQAADAAEREHLRGCEARQDQAQGQPHGHRHAGARGHHAPKGARVAGEHHDCPMRHAPTHAGSALPKPMGEPREAGDTTDAHEECHSDDEGQDDAGHHVTGRSWRLAQLHCCDTSRVTPSEEPRRHRSPHGSRWPPRSEPQRQDTSARRWELVPTAHSPVLQAIGNTRPTGQVRGSSPSTGRPAAAGPGPPPVLVIAVGGSIGGSTVTTHRRAAGEDGEGHDRRGRQPRQVTIPAGSRSAQLSQNRTVRRCDAPPHASSPNTRSASPRSRRRPAQAEAVR